MQANIIIDYLFRVIFISGLAYIIGGLLGLYPMTGVYLSSIIG